MSCFKEKSKGYMLFIGLATTFVFAHIGVQCWGSYLVFRKWNDWRDGDFICDRSTYLLSFSTLIIYWILWIFLFGSMAIDANL